MKYRVINQDLNEEIPSIPDIFTNYKYWARHPEAKTQNAFNMLVRFSDTMYLLTKIMTIDSDRLKTMVDGITIDSHFEFDIRNILATPDIEEPRINFKDTLTILCSMIVSFYHWRTDNKVPNLYDISKKYVTTPYENQIIGKLYNREKYFDNLFQACHVHLYNLANKKVSDIPESGTQVCACLKTIFN